MVDAGIIRSATAEEKKDYIEIGNNLTYEQRFQREVSVEEQKFTKLHKPYDRKGAYFDFEDKKSEIIKKYQRLYGDGAENYIKYEDFKIDLVKYGDASRFLLLDEAEVREDKLLDGIRVSVITGKWMNYQCVNHKGRISVFVPLQSIRTTEELEKGTKKVTELK